MSEKRFTIDKIFKEYPKLRDNETECFYHLVDNERNAEIFCERLNNLVEENEKLRFLIDINSVSERKKLERQVDEQQATISALTKENKELGKNFEDLVEWVSGIAKRNVVLDEQIGQLQRENEQLRQQLKEKEEDEQLYANEIVKLNKEAKEVLDFKSLGGDY